ncbi:tetratricopeptide repeat protein [Flavobacterium agrisoli]|uniref:Tetratricopeptide repeat protein n=1 Tax=Flavobacterium agrisoli TaxID=2793066 RepID=A0A934PLK1_9FLAO|nr:tetratricopeptide repeat protein [Flavobacterium agrisoli]MBK0370407.1 hypothetical protein [Flavobacterium agrisoli]
MNSTDYTYLLNKPETITEKNTDDLTTVLNEFPYFQSARSLRLKGLYNANSFKYNYALKVTAAHTTDRSVLFDFITSTNFTTIQKEYFEKKELALLDMDIVDMEHVVAEKPNITENLTTIDPLEKSILTSIQVSDSIVSESSKTVEENLDLGKPLDFSSNEKHSFQEWLQLSRVQPIQRKEEKSIPLATSTNENNTSTDSIDEEKKKKAELIDRFIESNPKISPIKASSASTVQIDINKEDNTYLMTETLARVYLEQKKYTKAIQAYEILILKYPEKISFFADRISDIKTLQQNNNNN